MNRINTKDNQTIDLYLDIPFDNLKPDIIQDIVRNTLLYFPKSIRPVDLCQ